MGLDFRGSNAQWSYGGFMSFRIKLAEQIGIDLRRMEGFTDHGIAWSSFPKDPIHLLLNHSDCEGHLTAKQCARVAPRLRELVAEWPSDIQHAYDKDNALLLAKGMEQCARKNKRLEFC